ncbi:MAG TPA: hypothetical protein VNB90_02600 [Cytophagaceae bacterium]|jgi:hypothetical protein|nr:hypothetical protein [Cytophagaceae bacterium]
MNQSKLLPFLIFGFLAVFVFSCKKDNPTPGDGTGYTDLQVYAVDANEQPIEGALVQLYSSEADRAADNNSVYAGLTGSHGFAYFSKLPPITFYASVKKDFGSGNVKTGTGDTGVPIKSKEQSAITVELK